MIEFHCPNCNNLISVPDKAAGKAGICPKCYSRVVMPGERARAGAASVPEDKTHTTKLPPIVSDAATADMGRQPCPVCGMMIAAMAKICPFCGENIMAAAGGPLIDRDGAPRQSGATGETTRQRAAVSHTARGAAVTGDTTRQRAAVCHTTRKRAVVGDTTRRRAVVGGAARRNSDYSSPIIALTSPIIALMGAVLVGTIGFIVFSDRQSTDLAQAQAAPARRQRQETYAQADKRAAQKQETTEERRSRREQPGAEKWKWAKAEKTKDKSQQERKRKEQDERAGLRREVPKTAMAEEKNAKSPDGESTRARMGRRGLLGNLAPESIDENVIVKSVMDEASDLVSKDEQDDYDMTNKAMDDVKDSLPISRPLHKLTSRKEIDDNLRRAENLLAAVNQRGSNADRNRKREEAKSLCEEVLQCPLSTEDDKERAGKMKYEAMKTMTR